MQSSGDTEYFKWASRTQVLRNADLTWYRPGGLIESNENQIVVGQHLPFTDPNQQP
ncbi:MAG: hypothetical protein HQ567_28565 [Candidatus Nealsonbacteria bacterium]|nr:hypothetical protein [Candidatus Nealsonbacteria bacterium]